MSKFDYVNFGEDGWDTEFVTHARTYTKEEAIELCLIENDWRFSPDYCDDNLLRKPLVTDVIQRQVRYYPLIPDFCGWDSDGDRGCYSYCGKDERGSFPVWVIKFKDLEREDE